MVGRIFGIGLILFKAKDPQQPAFEIRVRAAKYEPDMFYVYRCMGLIEDQLFGYLTQRPTAVVAAS